ncbi:phosphate ABC transporter substrate-binding protein [Thioalkalivibrio denitrificans]|uniref:Phosphate ABC transporter substrate-binding protein n=1 Tax=Thioalkalivibrio denitrificans TaxID=108003 RepID=A0A1V3NET6_9GAMM|nr:substrate-binding domain-containing protein [Thioalkalivibrio denitrificans]OOG23443.1 phosphate ABC transporter substrate-binding protein [Thioalkalivibrio denitrificans]
MRRRHFMMGVGALLGCAAGGYAIGATLARPREAWRDDLARGGCLTADNPYLRVAARNPDTLSYQGTHILTYGAFRELAGHYKRDTGHDFIVFGGGCDDGITAVRQRGVHLGGLCCPLEGSRAAGLRGLLVARDIKAVVAHPDMAVGDIGLDELTALARGRISRWSELGGDDRPVALVYREHCPDFFEPVRDLLFRNRPDWSPRGLSVDTDQQLVDTVSRFASGVGVVSWVFARPLVEAGRLKVLAIDGVAPSNETILAGRYPLVGPLNVVTDRWRPELMEPFMDYLYSPTGQAVTAASLVPVSAQEAGYRPGLMTV